MSQVLPNERLDTRPDLLVVQGQPMWDAMASPVRSEMVTHLEALGEVTMAELAEAMDRAPDGLYHHMHVMESAGLVIEIGKRAGKRRPESVYALAGRRLTLSRGPDDAPGFIRAMRSLLAGIAARSIDAIRAHPAEVVFRVEAAWLTDREARRVRAHMKQVMRIVHASRRRERRGRRHSVVVGGFPTDNTQRTFPRGRGAEEEASE